MTIRARNFDFDHLPDERRGEGGIDMNDLVAVGSTLDPPLRHIAFLALARALEENFLACTDE
jgi:hypothetical protein